MLHDGGMPFRVVDSVEFGTKEETNILLCLVVSVDWYSSAGIDCDSVEKVTYLGFRSTENEKSEWKVVSFRKLKDM